MLQSVLRTLVSHLSFFAFQVLLTGRKQLPVILEVQNFHPAHVYLMVYIGTVFRTGHFSDILSFIMFIDFYLGHSRNAIVA